MWPGESKFTVSLKDSNGTPLRRLWDLSLESCPAERPGSCPGADHGGLYLHPNPGAASAEAGHPADLGQVCKVTLLTASSQRFPLGPHPLLPMELPAFEASVGEAGGRAPFLEKG